MLGSLAVVLSELGLLIASEVGAISGGILENLVKNNIGVALAAALVPLLTHLGGANRMMNKFHERNDLLEKYGLKNYYKTLPKA